MIFSYVSILGINDCTHFDISDALELLNLGISSFLLILRQYRHLLVPRDALVHYQLIGPSVYISHSNLIRGIFFFRVHSVELAIVDLDDRHAILLQA